MSERLPRLEALAILSRRLRNILPDKSRVQEHKQLQRRLAELGAGRQTGTQRVVPSATRMTGTHSDLGADRKVGAHVSPVHVQGDGHPNSLTPPHVRQDQGSGVSQSDPVALHGPNKPWSGGHGHPQAEDIASIEG